MNISKLLKLYIRDNPNTGMPKYEKMLRKLMGNYIISKVDPETIKRLLIKLDFLKYEAGNAMAKDILIAHAESYRNKKMNLRKQYHITSSTLFNVLEGKKVSIEFAVDFCKINNLKMKDNFTVYSVKKPYSIEYKENAKGYIKRLFEYAVKMKLIETNPVPKRYKFLVDERIKSSYLPKNHIKEYVEAIFKHKNLNGAIMVIIYILIGLDIHAMFDLKIKDIDFKHNQIIYNKVSYPMSEYLSRFLFNYFVNEDPNNKVLNAKYHSYLRCVIYRIRDDCNKKMITIESLKANYNTLIQELNEYKADEGITTSNFKEKGLDSKKELNDFKEFLRLKQIYGVD